MKDKKLIVICLLIGFIIGFLAGVMYGAMIVLDPIMDKALSLGNLSEVVQARIKERCMANWESCY